jgi:hypothetical protein
VQQISMIEGDSHLAICRPAIDIETPSRSLTLEWQTSAGARAIVIGSANSLGRLGKLRLIGLPFDQPYECEVAALRIVNPLLTHLSHVNGIPLLIWQIHIGPARDTRTFVRTTMPFSATRHGNRQHVFPQEYEHLGAAYREGLNLLDRSPLFALLSFYKVFEGARAIDDRLRRRQMGDRERQRVPADRAEAARWIAEALRLQPPAAENLDDWVPVEALGRSFGWIADQVREIRNRVAHGLVDPDNPNSGVSSVDDPLLMVAVQRWLPIVRALANRTLDRSGIAQVPLGLLSTVTYRQTRPSEST